MARYFFNIENGHTLADTEGTELPSLKAAKNEAIQLLSDSLRNKPDVFWGAPSFAVVVRDETGLILFTLDVGVTMAPAVERPTR